MARVVQPYSGNTCLKGAIPKGQLGCSLSPGSINTCPLALALNALICKAKKVFSSAKGKLTICLAGSSAINPFSICCIGSGLARSCLTACSSSSSSKPNVDSVAKTWLENSKKPKRVTNFFI